MHVSVNQSFTFFTGLTTLTYRPMRNINFLLQSALFLFTSQSEAYGFLLQNIMFPIKLSTNELEHKNE